ncbi:hypothetical protein SDC9_113481 [bioreactor metagenome]|uniref:Uncharacterized protein n=1 Tax=bioreactor metagenome TaxID=1076179 RepID=A0A645BPR0_9ZZZZ
MRQQSRAGIRLKEDIRHVDFLELGLLRQRTVCTYEAEALAAEVHDADQARPSRVRRKDRRRWVAKSSFVEHAIHQKRFAILAAGFPVPLPCVAEQDRVPLKIHHVHLGKIRHSAERMHGGDHRGAACVALRRVAVAFRKQVTRRKQRQLVISPVRAKLLEVRGVARVTVALHILFEPQIEPHRIGVPFRRHRRVNLEYLSFQRDPLSNRILRNLLDKARYASNGIIDELRPQLAEKRHVVRNHVAHARELADDADAHRLHPPHGLRRRAKVREERGEFAVHPAARIIGAGNSRAQQRVCVVLRAVDPLIDREFQLLKIVPDRLIRLDERERERQAVFLHRADEILPLRIAAKQNQDAVQAFTVVFSRHALDVGSIERKPVKAKRRRSREIGQNLAHVIRLPRDNAREDRLIRLQHQRKHADLWQRLFRIVCRTHTEHSSLSYTLLSASNSTVNRR